MKKFTLAAAAALALATTAPATAETTVSDDPFATTQASLALPGLAGAAAIVGTLVLVTIVAATDT
ncbi:MAG: hypothetical protein JXR13_11030 [Thalassovita sp.]